MDAQNTYESMLASIQLAMDNRYRVYKDYPSDLHFMKLQTALGVFKLVHRAPTATQRAWLASKWITNRDGDLESFLLSISTVA